MPKGNPNPSPETRFKKGSTPNPGGKTKKKKALEIKLLSILTMELQELLAPMVVANPICLRRCAG
mgnify:CR=1 FL=1